MSTKPIKARRMWANKIDLSDPLGFRVFSERRLNERTMATTPIAVLDISDEEALIEQVAKVLAGGHFQTKSVREMWSQAAEDVFSSMGIIRPKRKGRT